VLCKKAARRGGFHVTSDNFYVRLCALAANVGPENVPVKRKRSFAQRSRPAGLAQAKVARSAARSGGGQAEQAIGQRPGSLAGMSRVERILATWL
jgi:hypothetical protein